MAVCITGMHRSGTSLVTNLLRLCGLYLGDEQDLMPATPDNQSGYWENRKFVHLNDEILAELGGTWDLPPVTAEGWAEQERFNNLRIKAERVLEEFHSHGPWGWKDPRNSLTMPFWINLGGFKTPFLYGQGPKLKTVICVRNPFEVFYSLRDRVFTPNAAGLNLWLIYNQTVLDSTLPEDRIVTHYEVYFRAARDELRRVLRFLNLAVSEELIERSVTAISDELRHHQFREQMADEVVDPGIAALYQALCREADYDFSASQNN
jgi:hypothetical protein